MIPCNPCSNEKCGSCVADNLERAVHIRRAKDHCGCAENGNKNDLQLTTPKIKSMLGTSTPDNTPPAEIKVIDDEVDES